MLGITRIKQGNAWAVYGKHPVTKDYFMLGVDNPIFKALSSWVENGYKNLGQETPVHSMRSFRFWAKGHDKGTLICGVVKDSSDSLGRPFPLLIIGMGQVKGLKQYWENILAMCETTWYDLERLSARHFADLNEMAQGLQETPFPNPDLQSLPTPQTQGDTPAFKAASLGGHWQALNQNKETFIPLDSLPHTDQMQAAQQLHGALKTVSKETPNAVFLGGIPEKPCMAVFKRPLQMNDFVKLWTIGL